MATAPPVGFAGHDEDRAAVIYHSRARGLFVAIDEATGRELAAAPSPERVSWLLFEELKAKVVRHCYLLARPEPL